MAPRVSLRRKESLGRKNCWKAIIGKCQGPLPDGGRLLWPLPYQSRLLVGVLAEEVHWARVRAAMAAVALRKGGRRWRPCAARAVVKAVRVAGGGGTIANESSAIDEKLGPKMVTTAAWIQIP